MLGSSLEMSWQFANIKANIRKSVSQGYCKTKCHKHIQQNTSTRMTTILFIKRVVCQIVSDQSVFNLFNAVL